MDITTIIPIAIILAVLIGAGVYMKRKKRAAQEREPTESSGGGGGSSRNAQR